MALVDDVQPASYRGISFLVTNTSISGGIKNAKHLFPNSTKQSIESLGALPDSYELEIVITPNPDGEFYFEKRDNLLRVIREGIPGVLVHPFYGQLENIVATKFSGAENFTELGKGLFNVTFEFSDSDGQAVANFATLPNLRNQVQETISIIENDFAITFEVSNKYPSNFTSAIAKLEDMVAAFNGNTSFLSVSADAINTFSNELGNFEDDITSLIANPVALAESITSLFNTVNALYDTVNSTYDVFTKFFGFGEDDPDTPSDTVGRAEENRNNGLMNGIIQSQSLCLGYDNAAQIQFQTVAEIEEIEEQLQEQYLQIQANEDLNTDTIGAITDLRSTVQDFFNEAKLNASQIISIRSNVVPAPVLAYQFYGSTDLTETLIDLNNDLNTSFLEGDLDIITQ